MRCPMTRTRCGETFQESGENVCQKHGRVWINPGDSRCPVLDDTERCKESFKQEKHSTLKKTLTGGCPTHGEVLINPDEFKDEL